MILFGFYLTYWTVVTSLDWRDSREVGDFANEFICIDSGGCNGARGFNHGIKENSLKIQD
jgi:hypothetical protein